MKKRQELIKDRDFSVIRTNPDAPDFNIYRLINQIRMHIDQVTIKSTRNLLIDDLSRELLEALLELKSKYKEVKVKLIKNIVKNVLPEYKKWLIKKNKETKSKYLKKKISYCLKCGKKAKTENIEGLALENKIGQQKSTCVVCNSKKSTFLKPIKTIKTKNSFRRL